VKKKTNDQLYNELIDRIIFYTCRDGGMYEDVIFQFLIMNPSLLYDCDSISKYQDNKNIKIRKGKVYYDRDSI